MEKYLSNDVKEVRGWLSGRIAFQAKERLEQGPGGNDLLSIIDKPQGVLGLE